jgi:Tfp pilus assembly protein PilF
MAAMQTKQWDAAIEQFTKGTEMDPKQYAIWANLAESYAGSAGTKTGADQLALQEKAVQSYAKALELKPDDAGAYNNLALLYAKALKFKEAEDSCVKAAALDPGNGGKCYFNIGAILTNKGQSEPAGQAFKRSLDADPKNPEAHYQYGLYLFSKATTTADGKVTPPEGTKEEFQKYLEISPNGPNAESAKGMIQAIDATVSTTFVNPDAKQKKSTKKK